MNDTYFGQLLISMPNLIDPFFQKIIKSIKTMGYFNRNFITFIKSKFIKRK